jgi:heterotetrameric sarcosine oxidase gamma subunit
VARSPIDPAPPVTVEQGWQISARRSTAALRITDCSPLTKVLVKAPADGPVAALLAVDFARAARDAAGVLVIGSGPGEWLLLAPPARTEDVVGRLKETSGGAWMNTFDVTHGRALLRLGGTDAPALLSKVCAIDFSDAVTPNGAAFRSSVATLVTDVVRDDSVEQGGKPSYLLGCERSSGQYLFDALLDAGGEFAIEVDGFVFPGI